MGLGGVGWVTCFCVSITRGRWSSLHVRGWYVCCVALSVPRTESGVPVVLFCEGMIMFRRLEVREASKVVRRHVRNMVDMCTGFIYRRLGMEDENERNVPHYTPNLLLSGKLRADHPEHEVWCSGNIKLFGRAFTSYVLFCFCVNVGTHSIVL